jgi:hypothetical protein
MKKNICNLGFSLLIITFGFQQGFAQLDQISLRDKIYFGGNIGLAFGDITQIEIEPYVGYRFTPRFSAGLGGSYKFYKNSQYQLSYRTSIYGGNLFTKYTIVRDFPSKGMSIFTQAQYEALSLEKKYFQEPFNGEGRFLMHSFLIGGGVRQYLGGRASIEITVLFVVNEVEFSPYQNPEIRIGFNF